MNSMKIRAMLAALSLLMAGTALNAPAAHAADWLALEETYNDAWVESVEQELTKKDYRWLFSNDPRSPQITIVRLLNQAAAAHQAGDAALTRSFVERAIKVLEEGVEQHYYSMSEIEPIISFIREMAPVKV